MKGFSFLAIAFASAIASNAFAVPEVRDISVRDALPDFLDLDAPLDAVNDLFKRKGGGGKGGSGGSSSGSSSGGSSGSSGGSSSGSRPASSSGGSTGGSTGSRGTSVSPTYGGGRYYGGGSSTAYGAGQRSPRGGISPFLFAAPLLIFPGLWLAAAYAYPYSHPYSFYNRTATNSSNPNGTNQTKPVTCLCQEYNPCGCDDNGDSSYLNGIIGNGSYAALNKTLVNVADVNGTNTIVINGTLPNDTSDSTTSGGSSSGSTGAAAGVKIIEWSGYWVMAGTVLFAVWGL